MLVLTFVWLVLFTSLLHIQSVLITTENKDINPEIVQKAAEKEVLDKNTLIFSILNFEKTILKNFPEISRLSCERHFLSRSLECDALGFPLIAVFKHEGKKYYMNENGVVIVFDSRKLGLPTFDLVLNPVAVGKPQNKSEIRNPKSETNSKFEIPNSKNTQGNEQPATRNQQLETSNQKSVFTVVVGKKILEPSEIHAILTAIDELEKTLGGKVINAQYIQVAGELSLMLQPATSDQKPVTRNQLTVLFDIRRDLDQQMAKLDKFKQVFDLGKISRIDLSIDGEKIFYR